MSKKVIAIILALVLSFSIVAVPVAAADIQIPSAIEHAFYQIVEKLINWLLKYFNKYWPGFQDKWSTIESADGPVEENFFPGEETFDTAVDPDAKWEVGYSSASLLDGLDIMNGDFFMAGSLEAIQGRVPTKIVDDQKVRVYAISDGVSGTFVHAVIDGFGFSRGDVEIIRSRFAEFAAENNVVSANVSVLHQHSCIDTLGMNVPLVQALFINTGNAATDGMLDDNMVTKNPEFMENLFNKTVFAMKKAVKSMREGTLSYGYIDAEDFMHDKRAPISFDTNVKRLRFVPDDGTAETWVVEAGIHMISLGAGGTELTGDVPYYVEKYIRENGSENGANLVYIQGAELAITKGDVEACPKCGEYAVPSSTNEEGQRLYKCTECEEEFVPEEHDRYEAMNSYASLFGKQICKISNDVELDPVLNIVHKEVLLSVDNGILTLASREGILNPIILKDGEGYKMVTEIGYLELGNKVATFLCPGEFDPMLVYGGPGSGSAAWSYDSWDYEAMANYTGFDNEHVMVFGLCNDQAGYVIRDNEYHSLFDENEEVNIVSRTAGSTFNIAFADLIASVKD